MNSQTPYVDVTAVDTPEGMEVALAPDQIAGVPVAGTGLAGAAYAPGSKIENIGDLREIVAQQGPDAEFTATEIGYGAKDSDTTLTEFLGEDGASVTGNGDLEMGPSGLVLEGYIYIPAGIHEIAVASDDGFALEIGGVPFSDYPGVRGVDVTARTAEFAGGLYKIKLEYFDKSGNMALGLAIDGLPVDMSAFYKDPADLESPDPSLALIPTDIYHPSHFIGEAVLDDGQTPQGSSGHDDLQGDAGDETISGGAGDDQIHGGYGDDKLDGGDGDDVLDGGRGNDFLMGGAGDDILVSRSDAGEQRIGQLALGVPNRPDGGEVNYDREKLAGWESQALEADDFLMGGDGADLFLFAPQINAKLEIIQKHVRSDGTINWAGVAGENDELHDHWVDHWGIDTILDYEAGVDQIAVIGHTAEVCDIEYRDVNGDGYLETIITVQSNQSGPCVRTGQPTCSCLADGAAGGAHDRDLLGQIIVYGDLVDYDDIIVDAGVTYGIVESIAEVAEALFPQGETKTTVINGDIDPGGAIVGTDETGQTVIFGYDTRSPATNLANQAEGAAISYGVIGDNPELFIDNPFEGEALGMAVPSSAPASLLAAGGQEDVYEAAAELLEEAAGPPPTRYPFEPLAVVAAAGETKTGDGLIAPTEAPETLPAPVAAWSFAGTDHVFEDAKGGPAAKAYTLWENQALPRPDGIVPGPSGALDALSFNGEDEFAYIPHDPAFQVTQGTIALWVQPADLGDDAIFLAKDQRNTGDGGHFLLGHTRESGLFMRVAPGDGDSNKEWKTGPILTEGVWSHIAVTFGAEGVKVYKDGLPIPDSAWTAVSGDVARPGIYEEAFLLNNQEPWVLGASQARTDYNSTAGIFGADDEDLEEEFEGALAGVTFWGSQDATGVLTPAEIATVAATGFDPASIPDQPAPAIVAADDVFTGGAGADTILGEGGDDTLSGEGGDDSILGGYGDDSLSGGEGNDTLDGGRGSDLLVGGAGDDVLRATSDAGEDRAAQMLIDTGNQRDPLFIDPETARLWDWSGQPMVADDILVGGEGADHFLFELQINGTLDAIMDNLKDGLRDIRWHGVAGENKYVHEHWVDSIGVDVIADFDAEEDRISVLGHTTNVRVHYVSHDSDADGAPDSVLSVITAYSQQGNGGGAHDEDILGYVVVHGDMVTEDMIATDAGVHYGIVDTVDELQEALAPTGEVRTNTVNGVEITGLDSRDVEGDPIGANPRPFAENPYESLVDFADATLGEQPPVALVYSGPGGTFSGAEGDYATVPHPEGSEAELASGTIAFTFVADTPGEGDQALYSKDHSGNERGGHFTAWIGDHGYLEVRFQDAEDETNQSRYLKFQDEKIVPGKAYSVAFSFAPDGIYLYVNGALADADEGFPNGMTGNTHEWLVGASARQRRGDDDNAQWFFDGTIGDLQVLDAPLTALQGILLGEAGGDVSAILADVAPPDAPGDDTAGEETAEEQGDDTAGEETPEEPGDDTAGEETAEEPGDDTAGEETAEEQGDDTAGEETPEEPGDDTAGEETAEEPGDDTAGEETAEEPGEDTAGEETAEEPGDDTAGEETSEEPGEDTAGEETAEEPGDDTAGEETAEEPGDDTAGEETAEEPGDDTAGEETAEEPGDDTAGEETPEEPGDDTGTPEIAGDEADNRLRGTDAAELMMGMGGNDHLTGAGGDDTLFGAAGDDRLDGQAGGDLMVGGDGDDRYWVDDPADMIAEGENGGHDTIRTVVSYEIASEVEVLILMRSAGDIDGFGSAASERLVGSDGDNLLTGEAGDDMVKGRAGNDVIDGGAGDDTLIGNEGDDAISGEDGDDRIRGGSGEDELSGGAGDDTITAEDGDDTVSGGDGDDRLGGGAGADEMSGGAGDDTLTGHDGDDILEGGAGADRLQGNAGDDVLLGGEGDDRVIGHDGDDELLGGAGSDTLTAGDGDDTVAGEDGDDRLGGGAGADEMSGGAGEDTLTGHDGDDTLEGGAGADLVRGNDGDDVIAGGLDRDRLIGGEGADDFVFASFGAANADRIVDFEVGIDTIRLDSDTFGALVGADLGEATVIDGVASFADGRLIHDRQTGVIAYDADGAEGPQAAEDVAVVRRGLELDAGDFALV